MSIRVPLYKPFPRFVAFVAAGAIAGLGQAPFDWPLLTVLGLGFAFWAYGHLQSAWFTSGWAFGLGYFGLTLHWIMEPFWVDAQTTGFLAVPALLFMAGGLALFWGAAFCLAKGLPLMGLCVALFAAEYARSFVLSGFPWGLLGYVWIDTPAYLAASIIGPFGMTLFTLCFVAGAAHARFWVKAFAIIAAAALQIIPMPPQAPVPESAPMVRMIHPDVLQSEKWDPATRETVLQRIMSLAEAAPPVDLIVWPETASYMPAHVIQYEVAMRANAAWSLIGAQRVDERGHYFNSAHLIDPRGTIADVHDKHRLVPFGEYVPLAGLAAKFGLFGLSSQAELGFVPGPSPSLLTVPGVGNLQPLICYEGLFFQDIARMTQRPDALVIMTNDAWFGTFAGPAQHMAIARARAMEFGLPVIRAANRGVSAMIDSQGRVNAQLVQGEMGAVDAVLPPARGNTIYAQYRDVPALFCALLVGMLTLIRRRTHSH
ncbi:MAG: apolipoprotein N-acyltransferase [Planktomarina sp.]